MFLLTAGLAAATLAWPTGQPGPPDGAAGADPAPWPVDSLPDEVLARLGSTRMRHGGYVRSLAFSPDGRWIVSAGEGGIRVWDATSGRLRHRLSGPEQLVAPAFSADGRLTWVEDGVCKCIDVATGRERPGVKLKAELPKDSAGAVAPGGGLAVVEGFSSALAVFDLSSGRQVCSVKAEARWPGRRALSAGGKTLAVAVGDEVVRLYDTSTGEPAGALRLAGAEFCCRLVFSLDARFLAALCDIDRTYYLVVWDMATRRELFRLKGGDDGYAFSPDGKLLAGVDEHLELRTWEVPSGKEVRRFGVQPNEVAFTPSGKVLAATDRDGVIGLWDVETGHPLPSSADPLRSAYGLRFSPDGRLLTTMAGELVTWEVSSGRVVRRLRGLPYLIGGALSPDGSLIAFSPHDGTVRLWDTAAGRETLRLEAGKRRCVNVIGFSADGRQLMVGCDRETISIWDVATGKEVRSLSDCWISLRTEVSPNGRWLATAFPGEFNFGAGDTVDLLDPQTGREVRKFALRRGPVSNLAFSPDSTLLASVGGSFRDRPQRGFLQVWEADTGQEWLCVDAHHDRATVVAFSPDGRMLATGAADGSLLLWEVATRLERHRFVGHKGPVNGLAFVPGGRVLAASSAEAPVYLWDVAGLRTAPAREPGPAELERAWEALAGDDVVEGFRAVRLMAAGGDGALALLRRHLRPVAALSPEHLERLLADLDHRRFAVRQKAAAELETLAEAVAPLLRQRAERGSAEVRRALRDILAGIDGFPPKRLRQVRAVEALEWMATPEALRFLEELAAGAPSARLTRDAAASRDRLRQLR